MLGFSRMALASLVVVGALTVSSALACADGQKQDYPMNARVVHGRFTTPVDLDGGVLRLIPATSGDVPAVPEQEAARKIWASPTLTGYQKGPLGYGLVTIAASAPGVPAIRKLLAWVGFAQERALVSCPAIQAPGPSVTTTSGPPLPRTSGWAAVVIGAKTGSPAVSYVARSAPCGTIVPASLTLAKEIISVPWQPISGGLASVLVSVPPCGSIAGSTANESAGSVTIWVGAVVPDVARHCGGTRTVSYAPNVGPPLSPGAPPSPISPATQILHGALGPHPMTLN